MEKVGTILTCDWKPKSVQSLIKVGQWYYTKVNSHKCTDCATNAWDGMAWDAAGPIVHAFILALVTGVLPDIIAAHILNWANLRMEEEIEIIWRYFSEGHSYDVILNMFLTYRNVIITTVLAGGQFIRILILTPRHLWVRWSPLNTSGIPSTMVIIVLQYTALYHRMLTETEERGKL